MRCKLWNQILPNILGFDMNAVFLIPFRDVWQSSGKSSVLESVVGKDFLPRGSGMVGLRMMSSQRFSASFLICLICDVGYGLL